MKVTLFLVLSAVGVALAQRPGYAGRLGIGYPVYEEPAAPAATNNAPIADRFGEDPQSGAAVTTPAPASTTTIKLPLEANGDINLIRRIEQFPPERQPFWYLNWKALEEHRSQPASYALRRNNFIW